VRCGDLAVSQKCKQSRAGMLYVLVILAHWSDQPGCVISRPSWSCGFGSRRPLQFIKIFDVVLRWVERGCEGDGDD